MANPEPPQAPFVESDDLPEVWLRFLLQLEAETPVFSKPDALQKAAVLRSRTPKSR